MNWKCNGRTGLSAWAGPARGSAVPLWLRGNAESEHHFKNVVDETDNHVLSLLHTHAIVMTGRQGDAVRATASAYTRACAVARAQARSTNICIL